ncbi:MAG: MBOAT family protein [Nitrospirae bacterium]|nr:MBOAT family protein [Magnetococcales bacterium]
MNFTSEAFFYFLPIVFIVYWFLHINYKWQNIILLVSSYVFYGWWDYRFLFLIFILTAINYIAAIRIHECQSASTRKTYMITPVVASLSILIFFKYFNFFIESFQELSNIFGIKLGFIELHIILPVGISFYTFQSLSYTIDVYRKQMNPERSFLTFATYISFFPQLVAGPIERASILLPQISRPRIFDTESMRYGLRMIFWGFFKKLMISDKLAPYVDNVYGNPGYYSAESMAIAALFFMVQIYCDFSGYSDIACGTSRLFGVNLSINFNFPYFAISSKEFWHRWHISLSTWFRDYVYIPIGGNHVSPLRQARNILAVFMLSGLWHGANYTFIIWGVIHGVYYLIHYWIEIMIRHYRLMKNFNLEERIIGKILLPISKIFQYIITLTVVYCGFIFFRSENVLQGVDITRSIFAKTNFFVLFDEALQQQLSFGQIYHVNAFIWLCVFFAIEAVICFYSELFSNMKLPAPVSWSLYMFVSFVLIVTIFETNNSQAFLYFQF